MPGNTTRRDRKTVEFKTSDGLKLSAWLFSAGEKRACILMSNGFSGSKQHYIDDAALRFQDAGYTALVWDNRHWGESEGLPRNETDPIMQSRDYHAAFDYAVSLPDVDPSKVVFWGTSMSGGNVIYAAAIDKRIRAVIAQTPFVSGQSVQIKMGSKADLVLMDRAKLAQGGSSMMVPVTPDTREEVEQGRSPALLASPDVFPFLEGLHSRGIHTEKLVTLQSAFYMMSFEPRAFIARVAPTPLLMIVGDNDTIISSESQLEMYQQALEPKKIHVIRNAGHFDVYYGPRFEENIKVQLEFLSQVLQE